MDTQFTSRDWTNLSNLVLYLIFQKLSSISDCLRFSVCKSWFSFVSNNYDALQQRMNSSSIEEMPLLMIFSTDRGSSTTNANLYSVTKGKIVCDLKLQFPSTWRIFNGLILILSIFSTLSLVRQSIFLVFLVLSIELFYPRILQPIHLILMLSQP